jgi:hypothetical protein
MFIVVRILACPRSSEMIFACTPWLMSRVAEVWRRSWKRIYRRLFFLMNRLNQVLTLDGYSGFTFQAEKTKKRSLLSIIWLHSIDLCCIELLGLQIGNKSLGDGDFPKRVFGSLMRYSLSLTKDNDCLTSMIRLSKSIFFHSRASSSPRLDPL